MKLYLLLALPLLFVAPVFSETVAVSSLDISKTRQDYGKAGANLTVDGKSLVIADHAFTTGVGTHANSILLIDLAKSSTRFTAQVGVDDEVRDSSASVEFKVKGDGKLLWKSGVMKAGQPAKAVDVDLRNVVTLALIVTDAGDGIGSDHADWADALLVFTGRHPQTLDAPPPAILTPKPAPAPRINGPTVFGVRPGSPFLYSIPATGDRPMTFAAVDLPTGLHLDQTTGRITGQISRKGEYPITLGARNALGTAFKKFRVVVGDDIALTPPMGWNSYNCFGIEITQQKALSAARAMVAAGLDRHGWTYINLDDGWQGRRSGPDNALQPDPTRFSDIKALVTDIHALGLKAGIYHTPWTISYGNRLGGTSENPSGEWPANANFHAGKNNHSLPFDVGAHSFIAVDARQFAAWGIDYLKYDWGPVDVENTRIMDEALRATGRDIVFSLSNNAAGNIHDIITKLAPFANAWRTTTDIDEGWGSLRNIGFNQDKWASAQSPGHFNDADMLIVGHIGWGHPHPTKLTPDEQYTHISLWSLLGAPLLLGCDLTQLDDFTLGLLTNDEVLAVDQDALCKQGVRVGAQGDLAVYAKPLEDGSIAVGLFNLSSDDAQITADWSDLKLTGKHRVRDLWRQRDIGVFESAFTATVAPHGVVLVRVLPSP